MVERFAHVAADEHHSHLEAARERAERIVGELMDRAKAAGLLRTDVGASDLLVTVAQLSRPPAGTACLSVDRFVHRHLQLFLDGLRAPARSVLPGVADLTGPTDSGRTSLALAPM